ASFRNISIIVLLLAVLGVAASVHVRSTAASKSAGRESSQTEEQRNTIAHNYGELRLSFEKNEGQSDPAVKFISRGPGYDLFLTASGAVINLRKNLTTHDSKVSTTQSISHLYLKML